MNTYRNTLFYSIAIGLLSAGLLLLEYLLSNRLLSVDGYNYIAFAKSILKNGWDTSLESFPTMKGVPPLLPLLMLLGSKCGLTLSFAGRLTNIIGTMLACQGILFICITIYKSRQTAFLTALMVCSLPKMYFEGCGILRDPLFWAEMTWCVFFIMQAAQSPGKTVNEQMFKYLVIIGLASMGCLTRKEGLPFLIVIMLFSIYLNITNHLIQMKYRIMISIMLLFFSGILVFLPYLLGVPYIPGDFILYLNESMI